MTLISLHSLRLSLLVMNPVTILSYLHSPHQVMTTTVFPEAVVMHMEGLLFCFQKKTSRLFQNQTTESVILTTLNLVTLYLPMDQNVLH